VARVGDEAPFAREARLEPREHRVQRLAEARDLVARGGKREPLPRCVDRDLGRAPAHCLDGPECRACEQVAGDGRQQERDRAAHQQLREEACQRLVAVLDRGADDQRSAVDRDRECSRVVANEPARPRQHLAVRPEHVRKRLVVLARRRSDGVELAAANERGERRGARLETLVELLRERIFDAQVDEGADRREDNGHRHGEHQREPHAQRQARHPPPSFRRR
jgi:hypothetical protein